MPRLIEAFFNPFSILRKAFGITTAPDSRLRAGLDQYTDSRGYTGGDPRVGVLSAREEKTRYQKYALAHEMDTDPLVSAILDTYAEDATQVDFERGRCTWVTAMNSEIKDMVEAMLDRIGWEEICFSIARTVTKYGDEFDRVDGAGSSGVTDIKAYDPWTVARVEDENSRLLSYAPADENGNARNIEEEATPFYRMLHFRLLARARNSMYGDSILSNSDETWRQLQFMEDHLVIQRLLRRPDRLVFLMDTGGLSLAESYEVSMEWERRIMKEWHYDPAQNRYSSQSNPISLNRDLFLPLGPNNKTHIEAFPATNTNDVMADLLYYLRRFLGGLHIPPSYFGYEGGDYQPNMSLSKQDNRFAKSVVRVQRAVLAEVVRLGMIELSFRGIDPTRKENRFRVHMSPVSALMEIERSELIQMRVDLVDRMVRLGQDMDFNVDVWHPYVLKEVGLLPNDLVDRVVKQTEQGAVSAAVESLTSSPEVVGKLNRLYLIEKSSMLSGSEPFIPIPTEPKESPSTVAYPLRHDIRIWERDTSLERARAKLNIMAALAKGIGG